MLLSKRVQTWLSVLLSMFLVAWTITRAALWSTTDPPKAFHAASAAGARLQTVADARLHTTHTPPARLNPGIAAPLGRFTGTSSGVKNLLLEQTHRYDASAGHNASAGLGRVVRLHHTSAGLGRVTRLHHAGHGKPQGRPARSARTHGHPAACLTVRVEPGDTLWRYAQRYHVSVAAIQAANHIHSDIIFAGRRLLIPRRGTTEAGKIGKAAGADPLPRELVHRHASSRSPHAHAQVTRLQKQVFSQVQYNTVPYIVRPGDTLWSIAELFGVPMAGIREANHLRSDMIWPGQRLDIAITTVNGIRRSQAVRELRRTVPEDLIPVYEAAGRRYGIPWTILAAIHKEESSFRTHGTIVSYKGALGPMQFMPTTFAVYGVTAPGRHGPPDINNVYDAIYSAAHMLAANGFAKNPFQALYAYNHSVAYVRDILHFARM